MANLIESHKKREAAFVEAMEHPSGLIPNIGNVPDWVRLDARNKRRIGSGVSIISGREFRNWPFIPIIKVAAFNVLCPCQDECTYSYSFPPFVEH